MFAFLTNIAWGFSSAIVGTLTSFFPSGDDAGPIQAAQQLKSTLRNYGDHIPDFMEGSYREALQRAKDEFKFVLIYLHSPSHIDTPRFCRDVLCTRSVSEFLSEHFVVWGGDLTNAVGYRQSVNLGASSYPYFAVLCNFRGLPANYRTNGAGISIIEKVVGYVSADDLINRLSEVLENKGALLVAARQEAQSRAVVRSEVAEQNRAFEDSLMADREKERKRQEEADALRRQEEEIQRQQEEEERKQRDKMRTKEQKRQQLPEEPASNEPNITTLAIRLLSGQLIRRRFKENRTLQFVIDFIDAHEPDISESEFRVVANYPRQVFAEPDRTLKELGLCPRARLCVEETFDT
mmetsp:Transcript_5889/g.6410  ORF Transcript_5889/g.6410 Transcript_5889/m.6410 type:complete len:350 (-) Transcript_5889:69-1118(-)